MFVNIVKVAWLFCIMITIFSVGIVVARFYVTGRWTMIILGVISFYFLFSILYNAMTILFSAGARF